MPAVVGAVVFCLSPYPFLTNLYVRAAVPEALGLGLLPWLLLAGWGAWWRGGAGRGVLPGGAGAGPGRLGAGTGQSGATDARLAAAEWSPET